MEKKSKMLRLDFQTLHHCHHPDALPLPPHLPALLEKTIRKENTLLPEFLWTLATSTPQFPQRHEPCLLTLTARCASFQRTSGRGSATSSWALTTSGRRRRASRPFWLVAQTTYFFQSEYLPTTERIRKNHRTGDITLMGS